MHKSRSFIKNMLGFFFTLLIKAISFYYLVLFGAVYLLFSPNATIGFGISFLIDTITEFSIEGILAAIYKGTEDATLEGRS